MFDQSIPQSLNGRNSSAAESLDHKKITNYSFREVTERTALPHHKKIFSTQNQSHSNWNHLMRHFATEHSLVLRQLIENTLDDESFLNSNTSILAVKLQGNLSCASFYKLTLNLSHGNILGWIILFGPFQTFVDKKIRARLLSSPTCKHF